STVGVRRTSCRRTSSDVLVCMERSWRAKGRDCARLAFLRGISPDRPQAALGPRGAQVRFELSDNLGMRAGDVLPFLPVGIEVIDFERGIFPGPDGFPRAHANGLLKTAFMELPVQELVGRLRLAAQRPRHREAI